MQTSAGDGYKESNRRMIHLINCAKLAGLPMRKKSHSINSDAVERDSTFTHRQRLRKFFSAGLIFSGCLSLGVPLVAIRYSALRGSSFRYGGSDSINSIAMIPSDHMSTLDPYSFCFTTSGAIQYGVPTMVARFAFVLVSLAQNPKSAVFV